MELFLQARHPHCLSPTLSGTEETWILSPQGMDPFPLYSLGSLPTAPYQTAGAEAVAAFVEEARVLTPLGVASSLSAQEI